MVGHPLDLYANWKIPAYTFFLVAGGGILAGLYPAFYITSFPPVMALNKSFTLSDRAKNTRKLLIGFQFVISITLIVAALFVSLQNRYIGNVDLGFNKENVLEVRLSMGAALKRANCSRHVSWKAPLSVMFPLVSSNLSRTNHVLSSGIITKANIII